jgi:hypothetical protein
MKHPDVMPLTQQRAQVVDRAAGNAAGNAALAVGELCEIRGFMKRFGSVMIFATIAVSLPVLPASPTASPWCC